MKYFSLRMYLTKEDYESYEKKMRKAVLFGRMKQLALPFIILTVVGAIYDIFNILISLFLFVVALIIPEMLNRDFSNKSRSSSKLIKRPMIVDFYSDRFEVRTEPDEIMRGRSERHYGFDTVRSVIEASDYIYFIFKTNNILIIPKRALDEEKYGMIKNLISNLFSGIYSAI
ncbi:MAG: YcxB family protein [Clostridia bacterium]|nr:YcxB family protein [Clostridia bacterium]